MRYIDDLIIVLQAGQSALAKAVLKKVSLQCQLSNGFQHLVGFLLQVYLLSSRLLFRLLRTLENFTHVIQKLPFSIPQHIRIDVVFISDFALICGLYCVRAMFLLLLPLLLLRSTMFTISFIGMA